MKSITSPIVAVLFFCLTTSAALAQVAGLPADFVATDSREPVFPISSGRAPQDNPVTSGDTTATSNTLGLELQSLPAGGFIVVQSDGVASEAGIDVGDILLRLNGRPFSNLDELETLLRDNGSVVLAVRDGNTRQPENIVLSDNNPVLTDRAGTGEPDVPADPTIATQPVLSDPAAAVQSKVYRLPNLGARVVHTPGQGMAVRMVYPGSRADQMNLLPGDIIVRINHTWTIDEAFDARPTGAIDVQVERDGDMRQLSYVPRYPNRPVCPTRGGCDTGHRGFRRPATFDLNDVADIVDLFTH